MSINSFNKYIASLFGGNILYNYQDKKASVSQHINYMLNRTQSMFKWSGLPDSIPENILEIYLQCNGHVCFYKPYDELYIFCGGYGGEPDVYYRPTIYTIANPALNISKNLKIDKDCVIVRNDTMQFGLLPLYNKYSTLLTENELSIYIGIINTRLIQLVSAQDERTRESAKVYLEHVINGELDIIAETPFLEGLKSIPFWDKSGSNFLTNLIEMEQYIKASLYNEIGLDANYNMKRESLSIAESNMNTDALRPLVDNMLNQRKTGIDNVNKMFGTNISVNLSSTWDINDILEGDINNGTENTKSSITPMESE